MILDIPQVAVVIALVVVFAPLVVVAVYVLAKTVATAYFSTRRYYMNASKTLDEECEL